MYGVGMSASAHNGSGESIWSIREFSDYFEITPRAVRFYEDKGLISPDRESGTRVFGPIERAKMTNILRAKRLGFTLDDIKTVMDVADGHVTDRAELIQRKNNFEKVIQSLNRRKTDIDVLTRDMGELCRIMSEQLENTDENAEAIQLAQDYERAFAEHFSSDNQLIGN